VRDVWGTHVVSATRPGSPDRYCTIRMPWFMRALRLSAEPAY
jgi:hypothetical protein